MLPDVLEKMKKHSFLKQGQRSKQLIISSFSHASSIIIGHRVVVCLFWLCKSSCRTLPSRKNDLELSLKMEKHLEGV